ncbi:MAG TPA: hypothetical protein VJJ22_02985 [Candidatus Paceibacterota bacterium]
MENADLSYAQLLERVEKLEAFVQVVQRVFDRGEELDKLRKENAELHNELGEARQQFADQQSSRLVAEQGLEETATKLAEEEKARKALFDQADKFASVILNIRQHLESECRKKARLSDCEFGIYLILRSMPGRMGNDAALLAERVDSIGKAWKEHNDRTGGRTPNQPDAI